MTATAPPAAQPRAAPREQPARTPRDWVVLGLGVVVLAALCLLAAQWQWHRYENREAEIAVVQENFTADPVPADQALPAPGEPFDPTSEWRTVAMTGRYDTQRTVLLRNRPVDGEAGFHVLVPFEITAGGRAGDVVVVDRGFVTWGKDANTPAAIAQPPAGTVTADVRLRPDEPAATRDAGPGQVQAISTEQVLDAAPGGGAWADGRTTTAYGALVSEDPAPAEELVPLPDPDTDPGSHLSYTVQWLIFALGAVGGFLLLIRRERAPRLVAGDLLDEPDGRAARRRRRAARPTEEEIEDAFVDAQEQEREAAR
ncbi:SURF1 family protein [Cellulomonas sp. PhB143]|uniref:SURF1 family cytochrome oxidase biogenesis protein n=1 Tax=Cellulomonas sp. PhB143 TaxID=2485186 RepID=UPI000F47DE48|nr:SURF1 family protein [Cellulomonas sp. PhB143]ROS74324.1 cytochrome oxidase assembly protein ShyY1 [Cellulomonas sp. PhB143]